MSYKFYSYDFITNTINISALTNHMENMLNTLSQNDYIIPPKDIIIINKPYSIFFSMPAISSKVGLYINKTGSFFKRNSLDIIPTINTVVTAFSSVTGEVVAVLDGTAVTNIKCAVITAIVTKYCTLLNASKLAIIGAGTQARQQISGILSVRSIKELHVYNRSNNNLTKFINEIKLLYPKLSILQYSSIKECILDVDIISTTTSSFEPLCDYDNLKPGVHINCMGAHNPNSREVPKHVLNASLLIVEDIITAIEEAGELHRNAITVSQLHTIQQSNLQKEQTVFSSTGFALLDLITVDYIINNLVLMS